MGDSYAEVIVHDMKDRQGKQQKIILLIITALLLIFGAVLSPLLLTLGIIMLPVSFVTSRNHYREYEYLLVADELDITLIKNRRKRKKQKSFLLSELQCMAPVKSHYLDRYHSNSNVKVYDYSSGNPEHRIYSMVFSSQGELCEVKVEPSETMLREIRMHHASIVYED